MLLAEISGLVLQRSISGLRLFRPPAALLALVTLYLALIKDADERDVKAATCCNELFGAI